MTKKLIIASAGAGKTHRLVTECIDQNELGHKTLIITYTNSNQIEISQKYKELGGKNKALFVVKGWYSFLLEELVRPYQLCLFTINRVLKYQNKFYEEKRSLSKFHLFDPLMKILKYPKLRFFASCNLSSYRHVQSFFYVILILGFVSSTHNIIILFVFCRKTLQKLENILEHHLLSQKRLFVSFLCL